MSAEGSQIRNPAYPQALPSEDASLDLHRVEPTATPRDAVDRESPPKRGTHPQSGGIGERLCGAYAEAFHHPVSSLGIGVRHGQFRYDLRELKARSVLCWKTKV